MKTWAELNEIQPLVGRIMTNSFQKERVSHAYLVQGSRGTGKKTIAKLIAMTLFCHDKNGIEPCQACHMCKRINSGNHPDVHWIEPEGKSIKNEQIEALQTEFGYTGLESTRKVYIISQAEALTVNAANRILKFLEEPEIETTALLLTDNGQGIIPTIRSRCQILDLKPLDDEAFRHRLINLDSMTISENNARFISALTNNIDEAMVYHSEERIYQIRDLVSQFIYILLSHYDERYLFVHQKWLVQLKDRKAQEQGLDLLLLAFKDIINDQIGREKNMFLFQPNDGLLKRAGEQFSQKRLLRILQALLSAKQKLHQNVHPTLVMEQLVLQF